MFRSFCALLVDTAGFTPQSHRLIDDDCSTPSPTLQTSSLESAFSPDTEFKIKPDFDEEEESVIPDKVDSSDFPSIWPEMAADSTPPSRLYRRHQRLSLHSTSHAVEQHFSKNLSPSWNFRKLPVFPLIWISLSISTCRAHTTRVPIPAGVYETFIVLGIATGIHQTWGDPSKWTHESSGKIGGLSQWNPSSWTWTIQGNHAKGEKNVGFEGLAGSLKELE